MQTLAHNCSAPEEEQARDRPLLGARVPPASKATSPNTNTLDDTEMKEQTQASGALCCPAFLSHSLRDSPEAGGETLKECHQSLRLP